MVWCGRGAPSTAGLLRASPTSGKPLGAHHVSLLKPRRVPLCLKEKHRSAFYSCAWEENHPYGAASGAGGLQIWAFPRDARLERLRLHKPPKGGLVLQRRSAPSSKQARRQPPSCSSCRHLLIPQSSAAWPGARLGSAELLRSFLTSTPGGQRAASIGATAQPMALFGNVVGPRHLSPPEKPTAHFKPSFGMIKNKRNKRKRGATAI